jgi:UDPglucose 6-dehydrogenase
MSAAGRLSFHHRSGRPAVDGAEAVFIAVGTPTRRGDGHADLTYVMAAAREIGRALTGYAVVVTKSTVPVGTNRKVAEAVCARPIRRQFRCRLEPGIPARGRGDRRFHAARPGGRGHRNDRARKVMAELYRPLYLREFPMVYTGLESAEMIKYAANAFLATKITFINEIAALCEKVGADVKDVARGMGMDGRIGDKFLHAGPGYGGSCFPKDTKALARIGQDHAVPMQITETVIKVNDEVKRRMIDKITDLCGGSLARQDHRRAGRDLQAQHRRHARGAGTDHRAGAGRGRGAGADQRSAGPPRGRGAVARREMDRPIPIRRRPGADLRGAADRMERVPRAGPGRLARKMAVPRMADLRNIYDRRAPAGFTRIRRRRPLRRPASPAIRGEV